MPIIKSAKKRVTQTLVKTTRNAKTKRTLREAIKSFASSIKSGDSAQITEAHKLANSAIDTAAKKNVIHKNKAARKKAQLSKSAKTAATVAPVEKPKKAVAKKETPKKVVAKKAAAKKPVAKKTASSK